MCSKCDSYKEAMNQLQQYKNALIAEQYYALAISALRTIQFLDDCLSQHIVQDIHKDIPIEHRLHA